MMTASSVPEGDLGRRHDIDPGVDLIETLDGEEPGSVLAGHGGSDGAGLAGRQSIPALVLLAGSGDAAFVDEPKPLQREPDRSEVVLPLRVAVALEPKGSNLRREGEDDGRRRIRFGLGPAVEADVVGADL